MKLPQRVIKFARRIRYRTLHDIYDAFSDYTMLRRATFVANLQLAGRVASVPGSIVECGTWKGGMIAGIAKLLGNDREYFLFDSFEGLPKAESIDGLRAKQWQENTESPEYYDNCTASEADAAAAMSRAKIANPHLVKGWFEETLPVAQIPNGIALLRMDADWHKSTYQILESLFPLVNVNGVRGKYVKRLQKRSNVILLEPDVAAAFPNGTAVNEALRAVMDATKVMRRGPGRPNKPVRRLARARRRRAATR